MFCVETPDLLGDHAPDASVRRAQLTDIDSIGAIHQRSWAGAYAELLPAAFLEALTAPRLAQTWAQAVRHPPSSQHVVLVACAGPTLVGFAAVEPGGELVALHVDPSQQRKGHGSRLLNAAVDHLRAAGAVQVCAWTPTDDLPRRGFLTSAGLAPDGQWRDYALPGVAPLREARLVAAIDGPPYTSP